jgi:hypothetical protein
MDPFHHPWRSNAPYLVDVTPPQSMNHLPFVVFAPHTRANLSQSVPVTQVYGVRSPFVRIPTVELTPQGISLLITRHHGAHVYIIPSP